MARLLRTLTLALTLTALAAAAAAETPNIWTFNYTFEGSNEQRLIDNAERRALREAVGRFHFADRMIIARDVLESFLGQNQAQYVAGVTVLGRQVDQGDYRLEMDVSVYAKKLEEDLEEFRFFVRPQPTPDVHVFLQETTDDILERDPVARPLVESALGDAGFPVDRTIEEPASDIDVAEGGLDPELNPTLRQALINAQRAGVEVIFTGQTTTNQTGAPVLLYDQHFFFDTTLLLRMLRSDTGELLGETVVSDAGSDPDLNTAKEIALRKVVSRAIGALTTDLYAVWPGEVLNQADYLMMATDMDEESLNLLLAKLGDIGPEAEVFLRSYYGRVACINLNYDDPFASTAIQERQSVVDYLVRMDTPQVRIESVDGPRIVFRAVR